ncbi:glycosyltransferase family 2 protein [Desulfitibacter alkalitolerans]|uniref:glycosyltransferase family 2 protein n=1 Tax=Desulfitibacter alkalitolerans TaxID=264641 RepID=UPI000686B31D|nr:glycosyltransferase family 2 protein [Desulfitibacter alkalitolerans]
MHKTDYFLVLNPDVLVTPMFIKELLISIEKDSSIGMVCGKLLRCTEGGKPTNIIDSTGLVLTKNRRAFDRGQGKVDIGQFDKCEYVFGCCGAAVLYRKTMLEDIKVYDEFFDNDFFAYKEDVDLSWRAQLNGWKAFYNYRAIGYHARGWKKGQRNIISRSVQIHSYKNRYLMLIKNEILINFLIHLPYILLYELCAIFYLSFKSPYLIKGWIQIKKLLPSMLKKRKIIQNNKKLTAKQFRDLIS